MDTPHARLQIAQRKSYMETIQQCYELFWTNPENNTLRSNNWTATYHLSQKKKKTRWTNSKVTFFYQSLHMDAPLFADQQELIYINSLRIKDVV